MSDTVETNDSDSQQNPSTEKAGDILRKERVTKRITIETIAKDLKLSVKYIKAIESNNFKELPADPYVRVYIRSIANYLMLDPDEILKKFFEDKGVIDIDSRKDDSEKIKIDLEKDREKQSMPWVIIIAVIGMLVLLSYISNKVGWISNSSTSKKSSPVTDTTEHIDIEETEDSNIVLEEWKMEEEEIEEKKVKEEDSLLSEESPDTGWSSEVTTEKENKQDSLRFSIQATRDSVWVQVFYDGISWKNFIKDKTTRVFYAKDSLNAHVGDNAHLKYYLNGRRHYIAGDNVKIFKIDHKGTEIWKMSHWKSVFKGRL